MSDAVKIKIDRLNIGAGHWSREGWAKLDNPCPHYNWPDSPPEIVLNLAADPLKPIPLPDNSVKLIFTSHLVEHLFNNQVDHLFAEVHRILKVSGVFRVACPGVNYYIGEYEAGRLGPVSFAKSFMADLGWSPNDIKETITKYGLKEAANIFAWLNPPDTNSNYPMRHVNCFDRQKLVDMMLRAGFVEARAAEQGDSAAIEMRDPEHFDYSHCYMSIYAEAVK